MELDQFSRLPEVEGGASSERENWSSSIDWCIHWLLQAIRQLNSALLGWCIYKSVSMGANVPCGRETLLWSVFQMHGCNRNTYHWTAVLITELQYLSLVRKCCMNTLLIDTYNAEDWYWPKRIRHSGWFLPFPGRCGALLAVCIDPAFTLTLAKLQTIKKGRDLRTKLKLDIY